MTQKVQKFQIPTCYSSRFCKVSKADLHVLSTFILFKSEKIIFLNSFLIETFFNIFNINQETIIILTRDLFFLNFTKIIYLQDWFRMKIFFSSLISLHHFSHSVYCLILQLNVTCSMFSQCLF